MKRVTKIILAVLLSILLDIVIDVILGIIMLLIGVPFVVGAALLIATNLAVTVGLALNADRGSKNIEVI